MRRVVAAGAVAVSSYRYTPVLDALMNFPEACCRNDLICSAADFDIGTVYWAARTRGSRSLPAFRQHSLISAPVHPSSSGRSPETLYFFSYILQIASRSSAEGRSKKKVPNVKRRRNSGGNDAMELQVAINSARPWLTASTTLSADRSRSPEPPTSELCIAPKSNAIVGIPAVFPVALATALFAAPGGPMKISPSASLSCIHVSIVPVISVFTPDKSVPVPAKAFSISSRNTITRGGSVPARIARRNDFAFSQPPISSKVSPPLQ